MKRVVLFLLDALSAVLVAGALMKFSYDLSETVSRDFGLVYAISIVIFIWFMFIATRRKIINFIDKRIDAEIEIRDKAACKLAELVRNNKTEEEYARWLQDIIREGDRKIFELVLKMQYLRLAFYGFFVTILPFLYHLSLPE